MFQLKSVIIILGIILGVQNAFPQRISKDSARKKGVGKSSTNSTKSTSPLSIDGQIYSRAINGIVIIATECAPSGISQGSGFAIGKEYIVTNRHVVECGNVTKVKLLVSQEIFDVDGVYFHSDKDIAILRVPKLDGRDISLPLAPNNSLKMGDLVYVLGNPRNIEGFFSKGNVRLVRTEKFFFDAPLAPGSSGSPVLDTQGRVVGIETTGTRLAGGMTFGGALFGSEVAGLLPSVQKGLVANVVDRRTKPAAAAQNKNQPSPQSKPRSDSIGVIDSTPIKSSIETNSQPKNARQPTVEELIVEAEGKVKYSPQRAIEIAQNLLAQLPKNHNQRELFASSAHGIIAESYVRLNQIDRAAQHILQAWKDGDYVGIKVKQLRENKNFSNNNPDSWKGFVDGLLMTGNKMTLYKQDSRTVSISFPNQSFSVPSNSVMKAEYNSSQKKLSLDVKLNSETGKEIKKDFQFYPAEASWQSGRWSYGMLKQVDCGNCSDILFALVKASNEFVRQEKQ